MPEKRLNVSARLSLELLGEVASYLEQSGSVKLTKTDLLRQALLALRNASRAKGFTEEMSEHEAVKSLERVGITLDEDHLVELGKNLDLESDISEDPIKDRVSEIQKILNQKQQSDD